MITALECGYARKNGYIEAVFPPAGEYPGGGAGDCPRAILSTIDAGSLRYDREIPNPSRERFFRDLGIEENRILPLSLVHSRRVLLVKDEADALTLAARAGASSGADGILSADPRFIPSVTVADCMPIWLWVEDTHITGVLHSGWKGTGIIRTAVELLQTELGVQPGKIHAILGPAIGTCCYNVDEARARAFGEEFGTECVARKDDAWYMDLRKANEKLAGSLGLGSVRTLSICTRCDPLMGSSRRQGQGAFTRMLALCGYF